MPKQMSFREISRILKNSGFYVKRQTGSHAVFKNEPRTVIVPFHGGKDIPGPTINSILKQAGLK